MTERYETRKQYRRHSIIWAWGVYDTHAQAFVEGGFFAKAAAQSATLVWNRDTPMPSLAPAPEPR